ncbi:GATA zinc finger domain-containing protein 10 [Teleopsis dalmanni]|uniref:GATA zinc finger domain-containing protein 10 n=1 Tax=Teleopsis dalmanni TaxID=139649 RepID=UPI0018CE3140|nr:GATA zinc finger domain-containing protein 10 [Teleopsis dalmanni]
MENLSLSNSTHVVITSAQMMSTMNTTQQQQIVSMSDIAELPQEIQEEIVSMPKEMILITLVSQEQALYNPKHTNYRNTQRKDQKWLEIAESVGWPESQCKAKWKAMRDQYCRELKRSKFNVKANVKWKYFKDLEFLRPYALSRNYRPRCVNNNNTINSNKNNNNTTLGSLFQNNSNNINCNNLNNDRNKYTEIKIDFTTPTAQQQQTQLKTETNRLMPLSANDTLSAVMQQHQDDGNWNYLPQIRGSNQNPLDANNSLQQEQQSISTTDDVFYNAIVDCVAAAADQLPQQQQQQLNQQQDAQQQQGTEEEDDDPLHTFLNMESYFEKELILLIQQEDILYNSFHPGYRNIKLKMDSWDEIARKLKKTIKQCRLKWKALRDQYIREHKRLKNRENAELLPRWKHYDALNFLQKFIKHKSNEFETKNLIQIPKAELDDDMDDNMIGASSPLRSPIDGSEIKNDLQQTHIHLPPLPSLSGPHAQSRQHHHQQQTTISRQTNLNHHQQQQEHQQLQQQSSRHEDNICVVNGTDSVVSGYDEMDIDNYIIGDESNGPHEDVEEDEDHKSQQQFPDYTNTSNENNELDEEEDFKDIKTNAANLVTITQHAQLLQHQQQNTQQQQQANQDEHILPIDVTDVAALATTEESLHTTHQDFNLDTPTHPQPQSLLNGAATNSNSVPSDIVNLNHLTLKATNNSNVSGTTSSTIEEDDEVGVFFKAVAMKIRNAKLSPVAFTDLQINILQVINGSLRNH